MLSGKVYRKVMRAGLINAVAYGTEIAPVDQDTVRSMRTVSIRAEGIWTSQVNQDVYWMIVGPQNDPMFTTAAKPIVRMAREVWYLDANAPFRGSHHDRLSGFEINELHTAIESHDPPSMMIRGIQESCAKLEVDMITPTRWRIGQGVENDVTVSPRPMLIKALANHWGSILRKKAAEALGISADFDTQNFQKLYAKYNPQKRRMLAQLVAGQVYTDTKAAMIGVEIEATCQICHEQPDTIQHRLGECRRKRMPDLGPNQDYRTKLFEPAANPPLFKAPRNEEPLYSLVECWEGGCSHKSIGPFMFDNDKLLLFD